MNRRPSATNPTAGGDAVSNPSAETAASFARASAPRRPPHSLDSRAPAAITSAYARPGCCPRLDLPAAATTTTAHITTAACAPPLPATPVPGAPPAAHQD
ncbi:hypothetical protein ZWY2020_057684 [Hordeum vulgare]|nr:hypothetical protein ZWY2020_057684 [Hordeum vulgare]